jgi:hypothetical protein
MTTNAEWVAECRFKFGITPYRLIFEYQERQRDTQAWFVIIKAGILSLIPGSAKVYVSDGSKVALNLQQSEGFR